jgi:hypothetical protein
MANCRVVHKRTVKKLYKILTTCRKKRHNNMNKTAWKGGTGITLATLSINFDSTKSN